MLRSDGLQKLRQSDAARIARRNLPTAASLS
jgi:hypothetical protein